MSSFRQDGHSHFVFVFASGGPLFIKSGAKIFVWGQRPNNRRG
jgi:hypothetical protein